MRWDERVGVNAAPESLSVRASLNIIKKSEIFCLPPPVSKLIFFHYLYPYILICDTKTLRYSDHIINNFENALTWCPKSIIPTQIKPPATTAGLLRHISVWTKLQWHIEGQHTVYHLHANLIKILFDDNSHSTTFSPLHYSDLWHWLGNLIIHRSL